MFFARKVSVFTILSYVFSVGFVFAADTTVTSKQYVDNQLLKKINLETGAGISAGDMLRATVDTNDANKMKWLAWTPDYITNSVLTTRLADYQPKINSISTSGTGNFVTGVTASNGVITATKGDVPDATATTKGIAKMYGSLGSNTDGSMTQGAIESALKDKIDKVIYEDRMALISRDGNGTAVKANSNDVSVANDGSFMVKHATTADSADTAGSVPWAGVINPPTIPTDISTNKVNGAPLSNENSVFYATSSSAAAASTKLVSIPAITQLDAGTIIVVQPTATSTVANSTIKLNDFAAYPMRYNNAAITTSTDSIVWSADYPSIWVFDGTYWRFLGHGVDSNTTYSAMSVAEGQTGTATSSRVVRADYLKQIIQYWANQEDASDLHLPVPTAAGKLLRSVSAANDTFEWAEFTPDYVTSSVLDDYLTTTVAANTYQTKITSDSKLSADLVSGLHAVATSGNYNDLTNKPTIPSVPTNVGDFTNNANYIKRSNGTNAVGSATQPVYVNASGVATATTYTLGASVPAGAVFTDSVTTVTNSDGTAGGNTAAAGSIKVTKDGTTTYPVVQGWANKQDKITSSNKLSVDLVSGLHAVATSGNYNDLTNKPTIPTAPGVFTGATASANGTSGLVKQPLVANRNQFLKGDGNWSSVTKSDVGLGNVDNTSDADKPISTATQTALDAKQNKLPYSTQYVLLVAPTTDGGQAGTRTIARRGDEITGITGSTTNGAQYIPTAYAVKQAIESATSGMVTDVPTASESTAGIAKLYTGTGSNTDGSMTQDAITSGLNAKVPTTRTVNGHALSSDITLSASDVGAQPAGNYASSSHNHDGTYVKTAQGATNSGKLLKVNASGNLELFTPSYATSTHNHDTAYVPLTRTVNGKALSSDITLSASDVGAQPAGNYALSSHNHDGTYVKTAQGATNSGKLLKVNASGNLELFTPSYATSTHNHDGVYSPVGHNHDTAYVPLTRTVNGKALSANISLTPTDIGAAASSHSHPTSQVDALTGYAKGSSSAALATTDTLNAALGKLENKADNAATAASNAATAASNAATAASNAATAAATAQSTADSKMSVPSATATGQLLQATVSNGTTTWSAFTPSYATTGDLSAKVDTTVAGDANSLMIRNTSGAATKPTSSDVTVSGTTVTIANNAVTSAKIADGTIMNADVASNAAIAQSKIANLTTDLAAKVPIAQGAGNANKALVVDSSGNVTSGAVKVPITDFSGTGGWAAMWID